MLTHDKEYFYKYHSAHVAKIILANRRVRWSSPLRFNDPFDTQFAMKFDFAIEDVKGAFLDRFHEFVHGDAPVPNSEHHPLASLVEIWRVARLSMSKERLEVEFGPALDEGIGNVNRLLAEEAEQWSQEVKTCSVFCVSEMHDNLLMWSHYGQDHKGVVLKWRCIPSLDTALCAAKPIQYSGRMPKLATLEGWLEQVFGGLTLETQRIFDDLAFTKSAEWSYEREWRCYSKLRSPHGPLYEDVSFYPQEIAALYLGCRISQEDKTDVLALLQQDFSHVEAYQARKCSEEFALEFERLK